MAKEPVETPASDPAETPPVEATEETLADRIVSGTATLEELRGPLPEEASSIEDTAAAEAAKAAEAAYPAPAEDPAEPQDAPKNPVEAAPAEDPNPAPVEAPAAPAQNPWTEVQASIPAPDMTKISADVATQESLKAELDKKLAEGELEPADYGAALTPIVTEIARLNNLPEAHNIAVKAQQDAAQQRWMQSAKAYEALHPELTSEAHVRGWDSELRMVTATYPNLDFQKALELAHVRYQTTAQSLGIPIESKATVTPDPAPADPAKTTLSQAKKEVQPKPEAPQTLRDVPGQSAATSVAPQLVDTIEQAIQSRDVAAQERIFEALPDDQQEAYLEGRI